MSKGEARWNPLDWTPGVAWDTRYALPPIQPSEAHAIGEKCGPVLCNAPGCNEPSNGYNGALEMFLCRRHTGMWAGNRPRPGKGAK